VIFMTDISTDCSNYCLLNIKKYDDPRKAKKKLIFVDPDVMSLRTHREYPLIDKLLWLANGHLQPNEYLGLDMPSDMNHQYEDEFIRKSIERNWQFKDNLQYICGIQYKFLDINNFKIQMKALEPIYDHKQKIVGLGNLCRLLLGRRKKTNPEYVYFQQIINYIIENKEKFYWIHIYGMSKFAICSFIPLLQKHAPKIIISVDNTKWTKCGNKELHDKYVLPKGQSQLLPTTHKMTGVGCTKANRNEFLEIGYIKDFKKANIKIQY